jgi:hypothetical protein
MAAKTAESAIQAKAAAKAQKTVANSNIPHNIVTRPSVSVARKTPSAAGMQMNSLQANSPMFASKAGTAAAQPLPADAASALAALSVPAQSYDGSTAAKTAGLPGAAPADATSSVDYNTLPGYNDYMNMALHSYNADQINSRAATDQNILALQNAQDIQNQGAEGARRNLAGSFAKRGMMGGKAGAFVQAQDRQNAELVANQMSTQQKIAALNNSFLTKFGPQGGDWTLSQAGQGYKDQAIQQALSAAQNKILGAQ